MKPLMLDGWGIADEGGVEDVEGEPLLEAGDAEDLMPIPGIRRALRIPEDFLRDSFSFFTAGLL